MEDPVNKLRLLLEDRWLWVDFFLFVTWPAEGGTDELAQKVWEEELKYFAKWLQLEPS